MNVLYNEELHLMIIIIQIHVNVTNLLILVTLRVDLDVLNVVVKKKYGEIIVMNEYPANVLLVAMEL